MLYHGAVTIFFTGGITKIDRVRNLTIILEVNTEGRVIIFCNLLFISNHVIHIARYFY